MSRNARSHAEDRARRRDSRRDAARRRDFRRGGTDTPVYDELFCEFARAGRLTRALSNILLDRPALES